jgi:hypothetical protein
VSNGVEINVERITVEPGPSYVTLRIEHRAQLCGLAMPDQSAESQYFVVEKIGPLPNQRWTDLLKPGVEVLVMPTERLLVVPGTKNLAIVPIELLMGVVSNNNP